MDFGIQFFPDVGPAEKSAQAYWHDALALVGACDELSYGHVRTVEHYFNAYGGYSPSPIVFLAAAAMRSAKARLITGAVLPVFNNPLKLAGEIGMLDAISGGRLEVGFARAFLPHEFARFGVSVNESRARFEEGLEQVRLLLAQENVSSAGRFHQFSNVTSLPRPTQRPHPPFWVAALSTPESFVAAGAAGHFLMAIPFAGAKMRELIGLYRDAWRAAGHPGRGRVMLAFHMFCAESADAAVRIAREPLNRYLKSVVAAASEWTEGLNSQDYPNYDKIIAALAQETFDTQVAKGCAWVGTPGELTQRILAFNDEVGGFESASLQVNFNTIALDDAMRSMRLFAHEVMPAVRGRLLAA
ncbi:MAG TPA: LLM class flavin-dependent oxidoreductase [Xanthobacteraceae bacterium]|jgi:alkanesulfonate monooxygenase SsuD/methylene tetrahydromethanopterin reductase-like flavin-dependent oxidoreductase (luciferase family)|nr:LLM class flavin-dependent oxidoreductase [Xanthobacteraceae bacterium]